MPTAVLSQICLLFANLVNKKSESACRSWISSTRTNDLCGALFSPKADSAKQFRMSCITVLVGAWHCSFSMSESSPSKIKAARKLQMPAATKPRLPGPGQISRKRKENKREENHSRMVNTCTTLTTQLFLEHPPWPTCLYSLLMSCLV